MNVLLDTHALLWSISNEVLLSPLARTTFLDKDNALYCSIASLWEICIKRSLGKLAMQDDWYRVMAKEMDANGIGWLAIKPEHCTAVGELPFHHRDPFDRLLVAQAQCEGMCVVSRDTHFDAYGISRVW